MWHKELFQVSSDCIQGLIRQFLAFFLLFLPSLNIHILTDSYEINSNRATAGLDLNPFSIHLNHPEWRGIVVCSSAGLRFILFWHLVVVLHLFSVFFFFFGKFSGFSCICNLRSYQYGLAMTFVLRGSLFPGLALQQPVDSYETSLSRPPGSALQLHGV